MKAIETLINDKKFRTQVANNCKKAGITSQEWNENKMMILMLVANEVVNS